MSDLHVDLDNAAPGAVEHVSRSALHEFSNLRTCISPQCTSREAEISSPPTEPRHPGPISFKMFPDLTENAVLEDPEEVDFGERIRKQEQEDLAAQDVAVAKAQKNGLSKAEIRKIKNRMSAIRSRKRKEIEQQATACRLVTAEKRAEKLTQMVLELRRENKRLREERDGAHVQHQASVSFKRRKLNVQVPDCAGMKPLQRVPSAFERHPRTKRTCTERTDERYSDEFFSGEMNAVASCSMEPGPATSTFSHRKCGTPMPSGTRATPAQVSCKETGHRLSSFSPNRCSRAMRCYRMGRTAPSTSGCTTLFQILTASPAHLKLHHQIRRRCSEMCSISTTQTPHQDESTLSHRTKVLPPFLEWKTRYREEKHLKNEADNCRGRM